VALDIPRLHPSDPKPHRPSQQDHPSMNRDALQTISTLRSATNRVPRRRGGKQL
jgi:hypothetical protein